MGWALHYFPFYLMARQLFLHHYFPALWFSILMCCGVFDLVTSSLRPRVRLYIAAGLLALAIWSFSYFSPLAYGGPWTRGQCERARWLKTWDFACNDFPLDPVYGGPGTSTPVTSAVPVSVVGGDGGRAAVVVEGDAVGNAPVPAKDGETTKGHGAVAQPGFDAFGNLDDPNDIKSDSREEKPLAVDKDISTVNAPEETTTEPPVKVVEDEKTVFKEEVVTKEETVTKEQPETLTTRVPEVKTEDTDAAVNGEDAIAEGSTSEGPLGVDEQEAELARNDLFADDAPEKN